jgi:membrane protein YdbS with pleckstrin-like domain
MQQERSPRRKKRRFSVNAFVSVYLLLLSSLTIAALAWAYLQTGQIAALAYLLYVVFDWVVIPRLTKKSILEAIAKNEAATWFGKTASDRTNNFNLLIRALRGTEAIFFVWLILSLVVT